MFELDLLVTGFPGMSTFHGGLGWSSVCLLQDDTHLVLLDTGDPGYVPLLRALLTDVPHFSFSVWPPTWERSEAACFGVGGKE